MLQTVSPEILAQLIAPHEPPCVSIYLPTHPGSADGPNRGNALLRRIRESLPSGEHPWLAALEQRLADPNLYSYPAPAVAVFRSQDHFQTLELPRLVSEQLVIADSFHIKPLVRMLQTAGRYEVLCLTQRNVELYQGNRDNLTKLDIPGLPTDIQQALGDEEPIDARYRGIQAGADHPKQQSGPASRHQAGDADLDRYFRKIDQALWELHGRHSDLPLILCAVEEYHDRFHKASKNPRLIPASIKLNPDSLTPGRLTEEAWKLMEPYFHQQTNEIINRFNVAKAHAVGSDQPREVIEAAQAGRIDTLLVSADTPVPNQTNPAPNQDDLLDDTAESVLRTGGQVLVIPPELMPTDTGMAAVFRY